MRSACSPHSFLCDAQARRNAWPFAFVEPRASRDRRAPCAMPPLASRVMRSRPRAGARAAAMHRESNIAYHHNQFPRGCVSS
ncbi:hypothetical protein T210_0105845 [Burkholderia pseudomallei MSHR6137]|nr:hypothetical protein T210_0105845 [Burkholderia pseudomallei MSHR6137]